MKREKNTLVAIFLFCIFVGIGLVVQSNLVDGERLYVSPKTIADYQIQIDSEINTINNLKQKLAEDELLLLEYEVQAEKNDKTIVEARLKEELENYLLMSGANNVSGAGVIISVDDGTRPLYEGEDINNLLVHDADILMIINELKKCKAEAIAVNGHRITPSTSITCSGYTIRMDGQVYARPFEIKAIGDSKRISNALLSPEGYGTSLKTWGVQFSLEISEQIEIAGAEKPQVFKFAKPLPPEMQESLSKDEEGQKQ